MNEYGPRSKQYYNALQRGNKHLATRLSYPRHKLNYAIRKIRTNTGYTRNLPKYNNKIVVKRNSNANSNLNRAYARGNITNILVPLRRNRGLGIPPHLYEQSLLYANKKWAFVNPNTRNVYAFALARNEGPRKVYIDLFGAFPSFGKRLMNIIKKNTNVIELSSSSNAYNFYLKQNFKPAGFGTNMRWTSEKRKHNNTNGR
jgi:hypothetical protein